MRNHTDHQLIEHCLDESDREPAWREFDRRFRPRLLAGIRRGLSNTWERPQPELLEELLQDCYCRLLENDRRALRRSLDLAEPQVGAYLVQVGRSAALDWLRRRGATKRGHDCTTAVDRDRLPELGGEPPLAERRLLAREKLESFWIDCQEIVDATANPLRLEVLRQVWLQQRPSHVIAADAGMATSSVDSLVCRTRRQLAQRGWSVVNRR